MVAGRVRGSALRRAFTVLKISTPQMARALGISESTLRRRVKSNDTLPPGLADRLYRLLHVFDLATETLGDVEKARHWLCSSVPTLQGRRPIDFVDSELGAQEVERILGCIGYGAVS